jgi:AraC-like DNA-binding protein
MALVLWRRTGECVLHHVRRVIGLCFEKQITASARIRRWRIGASVPRWPSNAHDAVELCWVERGRCRYRIGRRALEVEAGRAILIPAGVEHRTELDPDTAAGSMWLSHPFFAERALEPQAIDRSDLIDPSRALLLAAECGIDPLLAECAVEGLALRMLSQRSEGKRDPRIRRAIEEIEARHEEPLDVEDLARTARMSRYHFSRVFREETGTSPYQFLLRTRVDRAARLLASGSTNVTEAALAVGFTDLGRFGRAFKALLGRTPSAFLLEHRSHKGAHEPHGGAGLEDRSMARCDT